MQTPGIIYPNDYSLINLTLLSSTAKIDLKTVLVELSYHEDLFTNTVSGYLLIADSMGYIESMNLNGNEYLKLTFGKTENDNTPVDKLLRMFKISRRKLEQNMNTESYCLEFCSEELLLSEQYKLCKSYRGKTIASNISDIMVNFLKVDGKLVNVEKSFGVYDLVVPTMKPFAAINWLSTYARPAADKAGADMFLYEDKFGFKFRSMQTLMSGPVYRKYAYNPKNIDASNNDENVYNISTYEIINSFDSLDAINSGIFANQLMSINTLTREKKITNFNYDEYQKSAKSLNVSPIVNQATNRFGHKLTDTATAVFKMVYSNYDQQKVEYVKNQGLDATSRDIFASTYITSRTAQIPLLNYTRLKVSMPGDTSLTVGMVIEFSLLSLNPNNKSPDKFYSGNYLIAALRHILTTSGHKTVLEIVKESTTNQYNDPDTKSVEWQNLTKGNLS